MSSPKREQLVETALRLFEQSGFQAVGIDRVLAEANVAKMTLYKYFRSKDDLILAAMALKDQRHRSWFMTEVERRSSDPRKRLLGMFETLHAAAEQPGFSGCIFARAAAEFGKIDDPVHQAAAEHKRLIRQYIATLAAAAGANDPDQLAYQLTVLMDGAMANLLIGGCEELCPAVFAAGQVLIESAVPVPVPVD